MKHHHIDALDKVVVKATDKAIDNVKLVSTTTTTTTSAANTEELKGFDDEEEQFAPVQETEYELNRVQTFQKSADYTTKDPWDVEFVEHKTNAICIKLLYVRFFLCFAHFYFEFLYVVQVTNYFGVERLIDLVMRQICSTLNGMSCVWEVRGEREVRVRGVRARG